MFSHTEKKIIKSCQFIFVSQENSGLVVPWILGFITFMALEAVAMVYSNVLRDHVNRVSNADMIMLFLYFKQIFDLNDMGIHEECNILKIFP